MRELTERLQCVARMLNAQNAKFGRPLKIHDLADLVQDTTVLILKKLSTYEGRAPLEGWIYRLCCLEFRNAERRRRRHPKSSDAELDDVADPRHAQREAERQARDRIVKALERVGGVEAEAVSLKHLEGLTFEAIGALLGVAVSTVKARYYRGFTRLEQILASERDMESS